MDAADRVKADVRHVVRRAGGEDGRAGERTEVARRPGGQQRVGHLEVVVRERQVGRRLDAEPGRQYLDVRLIGRPVQVEHVVVVRVGREVQRRTRLVDRAVIEIAKLVDADGRIRVRPHHAAREVGIVYDASTSRRRRSERRGIFRLSAIDHAAVLEPALIGGRTTHGDAVRDDAVQNLRLIGLVGMDAATHAKVGFTRFTVTARPPVRERESHHARAGIGSNDAHAPVGVCPAPVRIGRIAVRADDERVLRTVHRAQADFGGDQHAAVAPVVSAARIVAPGLRLDDVIRAACVHGRLERGVRFRLAPVGVPAGVGRIGPDDPFRPCHLKAGHVVVRGRRRGDDELAVLVRYPIQGIVPAEPGGVEFFSVCRQWLDAVLGRRDRRVEIAVVGSVEDAPVDAVAVARDGDAAAGHLHAVLDRPRRHAVVRVPPRVAEEVLVPVCLREPVRRAERLVALPEEMRDIRMRHRSEVAVEGRDELRVVAAVGHVDAGAALVRRHLRIRHAVCECPARPRREGSPRCRVPVALDEGIVDRQHFRTLGRAPYNALVAEERAVHDGDGVVILARTADCLVVVRAVKVENAVGGVALHRRAAVVAIRVVPRRPPPPRSWRSRSRPRGPAGAWSWACS